MYGCGVFNTVFGRRRPRRSVSTGSLPTTKSNSRRSRKGSDGASFANYSSSPQLSKPDRIVARPTPNRQKNATPPLYVQPQQQVRKSLGSEEREIGRNGGNKKVPQGLIGISGELEAMIDEHQRSNYTANMKVYNNLGNLRQANSNNVSYNPKTDREERNGVRNIRRKSSKEGQKSGFCRAISTRIDPEKLKMMGNEDYKNGRFVEALSLYDAAISIDPKKASYRSNKSAALTGLGRLLEAVFEAREAIRIEPFYQRAHNRLATLYLRLGDADKTMHHYKQAGSEVEPDLISRAETLRVHLNRCNEAKKQRDWNTLLKETNLAISAGADSALQIYTLKAEALLKLHRHQEADQVLSNAPKFEVDDCTKFYGPITHANLLVIRAQVDLATGRIEDAMELVQITTKMDSNNNDMKMMVRRTRAVIGSRTKGNELFKAAKYSEACIVYGEGLDHDPFNSVLLCNRAACRTKLGQFEKAVEDCTIALSIRPSYNKARL